jgi:hypothetical protein
MMMTRGKVVLCAVAAALLMCPAVGSAQEKKPASAPAAEKVVKEKKIRDRVMDLETQVQRMDDTLSKLVGADDPEKVKAQQIELAEKVDGLVRIVDELKQNVDEVATADSERDARLDAAGQEIENLWKEIEALKAQVAELSKAEIAGYDNGFFVQTRDKKNKLVINGFAKPYYQATFNHVYETNSYGAVQFDTDGNALGGDMKATSSGFGLASTRLSFKAQVFEVVNFLGEIDYGTLNGKVSYPMNVKVQEGSNFKYNRVSINQQSLRILAFYGEFAPIPELKIRAGQFKVPFDRETLLGTNQLTFTSRSLMTRRYARWGNAADVENCTELACGWDYETLRGSSFDYDRGLMVHGEVAHALFNYAAGVFNGGGPNVGNDNRDVLVGARVWTDPLGLMTPGSSDIQSSEKPLLSVGFAYFFDLPQHYDPEYVADKKVFYNSEDHNITADVLFKWAGASVMGGFFYRQADHGAAVHTATELWNIRSLGGTVQAAYYIAPVKLEPAFRYGIYDADLKVEGDHVHEFTAAVNYYPFGQNLKLQIEYRGIVPDDNGASYMVPWHAYQPNVHELTVMGQVSF